MGLSLYEQETCIRWNRAEKEMEIYTADAYLLQRLKKLPTYKLVREDTQGGQVVAATFTAKKNLCTLRRVEPKARAMSDAEIEALKQRSKGRKEGAENASPKADS